MQFCRGAAVVALGLAAVLLGGCLPEGLRWAGPGETGGEMDEGEGTGQVPFNALDHGVRSGIRDARRLVIRDVETWQALWAEHVAGRVPAPPLPPVDFAREMVLAFFLGEKPTSGYTATITEVLQLQDKLRVKVAVETPPPGSFLLQVLTQPFHIVRLPRYDLPVEFAVEEGQPPKAR